jgi:ABC-2 type transport system permease protein
VNGPVPELVRRGLAALRRSAFWWGFATVVFAVLNLAFWPSFESSGSLADLEDSMGDLLEAFGAQGLSTSAGYLDGQLYALMLPLLLSGAAIAMTSAITSGDEDAGRLELLHALPLGRRTIWLSRWAAGVAALGTIVLIITAAVSACLVPFSLDEAGFGRVIAATLACGVLAVFHGSIAYLVGGLGGSRALSADTAVGVLLVGYVVAFVLPISDALSGVRRWSPWNWAIGEQPVSDGVGLGLVTIGVAVAVLVAVGTWAVERRDIRSA